MAGSLAALYNRCVDALSFGTDYQKLRRLLNARIDSRVSIEEIPLSHPAGFVREMKKRRISIVESYLVIIRYLESEHHRERIQALRLLGEQTSHAKNLTMPLNTARVQIALMKEAIKSRENKRRQLECLHDFTVSSFGQPSVIRSRLDELGIIEVPETGQRLADMDLGWDLHVHDNSSYGRKTPSQLVIDAFIKGISEITVAFNQLDSREHRGGARRGRHPRRQGERRRRVLPAHAGTPLPLHVPAAARPHGSRARLLLRTPRRSPAPLHRRAEGEPGQPHRLHPRAHRELQRGPPADDQRRLGAGKRVRAARPRPRHRRRDRADGEPEPDVPRGAAVLPVETGAPAPRAAREEQGQPREGGARARGDLAVGLLQHRLALPGAAEGLHGTQPRGPARAVLRRSPALGVPDGLHGHGGGLRPPEGRRGQHQDPPPARARARRRLRGDPRPTRAGSTASKSTTCTTASTGRWTTRSASRGS